MSRAQSEAKASLVDEIGACFGDPLRFVRFAFDWGHGDLAGHDGPDEIQTEVLETIRDNCLTVEDALRIAVASGHGIGKTALVAWIILWFMSTRVKCAGVVTANTRDQLTTKTWRELALWHGRAINKDWFKWTATKFYQVDHPDTWFIGAIPWTKERSEAFAGLHARDVLVIYDEASAVDDAIWEVSEGAMTTTGAMWIALGNPTRNTGRFRECFGRFKHRWITKQVDSRNSRFANAAQLQQWVDDYGEDSDFVRIRVKGAFPRAGSNQFISSEWVSIAQKNEGVGTGPRVLGVDVARFGDDQTVFCMRNGDKVEFIRKYRNLDTMQTAARVAEVIRTEEPDATHIDGVGVGGGVVDRLRQMNFEVTDINAGRAALDGKTYYNLRAEMWANMKEWLERGDIPADDMELEADLIGPEYGFDNTNRIQLEKKDDMKKRGLASPDVGDALAMTFAVPVALNVEQLEKKRPPRRGGWMGG